MSGRRGSVLNVKLFFESVASFIERQAGYIVTCWFLIMFGIALIRFGGVYSDTGHDLIVFATGVLSRSMVGHQTSSAGPAPELPPGSSMSETRTTRTDTPAAPQPIVPPDPKA